MSMFSNQMSLMDKWLRFGFFVKKLGAYIRIAILLYAERVK